jgi:hypothetical protein
MRNPAKVAKGLFATIDLVNEVKPVVNVLDRAIIRQRVYQAAGLLLYAFGFRIFGHGHPFGALFYQ